jgi:hypothetical protein
MTAQSLLAGVFLGSSVRAEILQSRDNSMTPGLLALIN